MARDASATIVFVEVKARATARVRQRGRGGHAVEAAAAASMALDYLARHRLLDRPCRFDVVAVDGIGEEAVITVYRSAFQAR